MKDMKITFGDYWDDGHGKYTTFNMLCNRTPKELLDLEEKAEVQTGYRFQTNGNNRSLPAICNKYEDSSVNEDVLKDLMSQGLSNDTVCNGETYPLVLDGGFEEGIDDFAEFFMRWLKLADPDLKWEWKDDKFPHAIFNCRGYGMFW